MSTEQALQQRSGSTCELCTSTDELAVYAVPPTSLSNPDDSLLLCSVCQSQADQLEAMDVHHWRCLNDSMWSQLPAVQVMAWRMLSRLSHTEAWAQDALDMMYLDEETQQWAAAGEASDDEAGSKHVDSNGAVLQSGDTVTLTKDLNVKGTSFVAKRGTAVRGIALVQDNPEHIEGKVNGTRIVILTKFVKRSG
ncbi:MAG: PhnA domain-containing protein [Leucothrix sp.]